MPRKVCKLLKNLSHVCQHNCISVFERAFMSIFKRCGAWLCSTSRSGGICPWGGGRGASATLFHTQASWRTRTHTNIYTRSPSSSNVIMTNAVRWEAVKWCNRVKWSWAACVTKMTSWYVPRLLTAVWWFPSSIWWTQTSGMLPSWCDWQIWGALF